MKYPLTKPITRVVASALTAGAVMVFAISGCPEVVPAVYEVEVTKDVQYGEGYIADATQPGEWTVKPLYMDVYTPVGADGALPAILLVHGGSFSSGSKEKVQIVEYANFFAGQGYVAFAMNYRLTLDTPPAPQGWEVFNLVAAAHAATVDVKVALRHLHANAAQYGVDPSKIALLGESAGAIAGVGAALTDAGSFVEDRSDLPVLAENNPSASSEVFAYIHLWGSADHVLLQVDPEDPPVMIVHGTDDNEFFTSFGASERFAAVLTFFGVPHIFYEAEGFGHGAWNYVFERQRITQLALNFLNGLLVAE